MRPEIDMVSVAANRAGESADDLARLEHVDADTIGGESPRQCEAGGAGPQDNDVGSILHANRNLAAVVVELCCAATAPLIVAQRMVRLCRSEATISRASVGRPGSFAAQPSIVRGLPASHFGRARAGATADAASKV